MQAAVAAAGHTLKTIQYLSTSYPQILAGKSNSTPQQAEAAETLPHPQAAAQAMEQAAAHHTLKYTRLMAQLLSGV